MQMTNPPESRTVRIVNSTFLKIEHALYVVLGVVLSLTALMALIIAIETLWSAVASSSSGALLNVIDRLLFVLMLAEVLHTVRVSISSGTLNSEPFLIVGLIASIRRVLVITLESPQASTASPSDHQAAFQAAMVELGVLGVLILVMVVSIYLIRRSDPRR